jgi:hypothetical protein
MAKVASRDDENWPPMRTSLPPSSAIPRRIARSEDGLRTAQLLDGDRMRTKAGQEQRDSEEVAEQESLIHGLTPSRAYPKIRAGAETVWTVIGVDAAIFPMPCPAPEGGRCQAVNHRFSGALRTGPVVGGGSPIARSS